MIPKLAIHGGLGTASSFARSKEAEQRALRRIAEDAYRFLQSHTALQTVIYAATLLEDDPLFNAGTGSKLQSDGVIRMTASIMDGTTQRFAGVMNIQNVKNPVLIAECLLDKRDRILAADKALEFARAQGFGPHDPQTPHTREEFKQKKAGASGTIGCVALDAQGGLAAATSTGGKGFEIPGRVSDSATVAGNYANRFAAVSCTGTGEDIVNAAVAARIVTRVTDGMPLTEACDASVAELHAIHGDAGFIAVDAAGNLYQSATDAYLTYALHDGQTITVFD